ncbi:hypothetical protein [Tautonia marina]|uniref:hypothetical protein n=1 Tax=Tautonia marina TaxID=2653855 RepID=UPI001260A50E|nr:hypothetical protein [Tautonia marina]
MEALGALIVFVFMGLIMLVLGGGFLWTFWVLIDALSKRSTGGASLEKSAEFKKNREKREAQLRELQQMVDDLRKATDQMAERVEAARRANQQAERRDRDAVCEYEAGRALRQVVYDSSDLLDRIDRAFGTLDDIDLS